MCHIHRRCPWLYHSYIPFLSSLQHSCNLSTVLQTINHQHIFTALVSYNVSALRCSPSHIQFTLHHLLLHGSADKSTQSQVDPTSQSPAIMINNVVAFRVTNVWMSVTTINTSNTATAYHPWQDDFTALHIPLKYTSCSLGPIHLPSPSHNSVTQHITCNLLTRHLHTYTCTQP